MSEQWLTVDEGWGRRAVEFATLLELGACREYVAMHQHLGLGSGDHVLDVACGSGLALELASARGATVSGIDASPRLVEIARDRLPGADVRAGDMAALPWGDHTFDAVTSFRGVWATTPEALAEAHRVLRPGGRLSVTTWGHVKASPGMWALTPFALAADPKVRVQAEMKALGRPGVGEEVLAAARFVGVRRHSVPFVWEFPDPETFARMLASTGPAYEAIQAVGEEEFHLYCIEVASARVRDGLPLRAEIDCVGFTALVPPAPTTVHLDAAPTTAAAATLATEDEDDLGFVTNATRVWMHAPAAFEALFALIGSSAHGAAMTVAERGVATITATRLVGDTYCPLAWGDKLAGFASPDVAVSVMGGSDELLDDRSRAIAAWAGKVATAPQAVTASDVRAVRAAGFDDAQVLSLTVFVALRLAFSTVNGALGARPEQAYVDHVDPAVRTAWEQAFPARA
ncbi:Ubiquinone/menaquinone biosynthesis C-methylase UbiE [Nocardioides alpinus]|uniref:Methyltransferase domain-containing protein n=1 Tax=Nocardioides alpinus TaxID=748909 RepID=A0A1I1B8E1_9ACTN|nr:methyltransferase domain-containing protein [Nocardioides alpinus]PKH40443.1 methyltransferase domain-containing protein [Nocardioides alpinus]SFB46624.1 Ubiquinone/menaquinone biosynthesis C-methylase UbiE [Nocardioides alpinus]